MTTKTTIFCSVHNDDGDGNGTDDDEVHFWLLSDFAVGGVQFAICEGKWKSGANQNN